MDNHEFLHELGWKAKDVITGFEGIIVYRVNFLTGCDQYGIQPSIDPKKHNEIPEAKQFDENRLLITNKKALKLPEREESKEPPPKGGPNYTVKI